MGRKHDEAFEMRHFVPTGKLLLRNVKEDGLDTQADQQNYFLTHVAPSACWAKKEKEKPQRQLTNSLKKTLNISCTSPLR